MKNQLIQLIRTLKDADTPVTSASLANKLNVSPRSVKSYIQEINLIVPETVLSSRKGYVIDKDKADEILSESKSSIPQTSEERVNYIINNLIKRGMVNAYDLCDEMFISYSTLKTDLVSVRKTLAAEGLDLVNQNDNLIVNGLEKNKRKLLSSLLYSESRNNLVNYEKMSSSFENIDVLFIKNTILEKFEEHRFFINDYSLENLILHSAITIDRICNGYVSDDTGNVPSVLKSHEYELANDIIRKLEEKFNISFNNSEVGEFAMLILSRASNLDYETVTFENVRQYVGEEIYDLANTIIKDFAAYYFYIDLSQPEFFVRFALHIKNLLIRGHSGYFSKNPLTTSIKQNCPLIYNAAVSAASIVREKTGINLNDDEIAYIAFHIGGALELQSNLSNKVTCSIFCPSYYNLNNRLSDTISRRFSDSLVISSILTHEEELDRINSDFLISTIESDHKIGVPLVIISPLVNQNDLDNIQNKISEISEIKKQKAFRENLSHLIKEELFFVLDKEYTKEEVIHFMAEKLRENGYASERFESDVLDRDAISSVAFGAFAIPHAMKMNEKKTGICISICKKPVEWDESEVELVMMLCFNRNERQLFNELFEPISMILVDPDNLYKVLKAGSAEEFISILSGLSY
ncbi:MAG: transcription antiterminator [Erysipelotrichaceae bacterium]|nr:transcription antiterminator [Erysipelotrichaceae bacterium]